MKKLIFGLVIALAIAVPISAFAGEKVFWDDDYRVRVYEDACQDQYGGTCHYQIRCYVASNTKLAAAPAISCVKL